MKTLNIYRLTQHITITQFTSMKHLRYLSIRWQGTQVKLEVCYCYYNKSASKIRLITSRVVLLMWSAFQ